jgi:hypothetical protein
LTSAAAACCQVNSIASSNHGQELKPFICHITHESCTRAHTGCANSSTLAECYMSSMLGTCVVQRETSITLS